MSAIVSVEAPRRACCRVDGCKQEANRVTSGLCEKHYYRLRRTGTTSLQTKDREPIKHSDGYVLVYDPNHDLRRTSPRQYEHRVIFYEEHGAGPFNCHWCKDRVTWDDMHVDHLNDVRDDNSPTNLVASCPSCNQGRARYKTVLASKQRATKITFDGVTKTIPEWAREVGISYNSLRRRISEGWPIERCLTEPRGKSGPQSVQTTCAAGWPARPIGMGA